MATRIHAATIAAILLGALPAASGAFMVNAGSAIVDVLDLRNPPRPSKVASLDVVADPAPRSVAAANRVDARLGLVAVAVEADRKQGGG